MMVIYYNIPTDGSPSTAWDGRGEYLDVGVVAKLLHFIRCKKIPGQINIIPHGDNLIKTAYPTDTTVILCDRQNYNILREEL